eukprot:550135-Pelagomonas_calceolata.AAC.1
MGSRASLRGAQPSSSFLASHARRTGQLATTIPWSAQLGARSWRGSTAWQHTCSQAPPGAASPAAAIRRRPQGAAAHGESGSKIGCATLIRNNQLRHLRTNANADGCRI